MEGQVHIAVVVNGYVINQYPPSESGNEQAYTLKQELNRLFIGFEGGYQVQVMVVSGGWIQVSTEQVLHRVATLFQRDYIDLLMDVPRYSSRDNRADFPHNPASRATTKAKEGRSNRQAGIK